MRKIYKTTNIALIFMLITSAVFLQLAYASEGLCLRVPMGVSRERTDDLSDFIAGSENLELKVAITHDMARYRQIFDWIHNFKKKEGTYSKLFYGALNNIEGYFNQIFDILEDDGNVNWESDFRNIFGEFINNIDGLMETICKEIDKTEAIYCLNITGAMKLFHKSFAGHDEIKDIDLERLFNIVGIETREFFIKGKKLYFESQESAKHIIGREGEIYRAFLNLVRNSVEAIRRGIDVEYAEAKRKGVDGPWARDFEDKGVINVKIYYDKGFSVIEITDNGAGMSKEALDAFRNRTVYSSKGELGGRGIKTARNIIKRNGGTIDVRSKPGKGTTFIVRLPSLEKSEDLNRVTATSQNGVVKVMYSLKAVSTAN